ncbi:WD repeat and FYVE domain-containing protein 2 isoform X3 [Papio anubis]|uniref:WD repeat and FYVE domain-containing protein 2 isoform X3 n=1 Tax=Papio anubis TaxID=9555 RepID=UPI0012AE9C9E|nr:WD repeat and FYVE domain-containing protein 2 isoform X3 [Papio anubis]
MRPSGAAAPGEPRRGGGKNGRGGLTHAHWDTRSPPPAPGFPSSFTTLPEVDPPSRPPAATPLRQAPPTRLRPSGSPPPPLVVAPACIPVVAVLVPEAGSAESFPREEARLCSPVSGVPLRPARVSVSTCVRAPAVSSARPRGAIGGGAPGAPPPPMAAEIQPKPLTRKPILLQRMEGSQEVVNMAVIVPKEEGVISVSEDRTVRVWLKRDSGQYWPSIYHAMPSPCSCMSFNPETRRLSIGLDNGTISEFILSEDYNKMTSVKNYQAHQSRVTMILFVLELEWVLSTGQDKQFAWHCSESGQRLGGYRTSAVASGLQFDVETRHVFIGDHSGQVTILKLEQENCTLVTTFRGHTGGVTALCWDPVQRVLFSGSSDHSVIMWDIGGRKGTAIELQGHNDKVQALSYAQHTRQLISCGGDGGIVVWNMDVERQETPEWLDSDSCQKCDQPFFWNFKQMWDSKKIGLRQHHCRKCGKAVCGKCSSKRSSIPLMGFEFEVRVCDSCHEAITDEERAPTATFHDSKHNIVHVHFDATRGWLLTSGTDKVIKVLSFCKRKSLHEMYKNCY